MEVHQIQQQISIMLQQVLQQENQLLRGIKNLKYTKYTYDKSKISDIKIQSMLFNGNYVLASRYVSTTSDVGYLGIRFILENNVDFCGLCTCRSNAFIERAHSR